MDEKDNVTFRLVSIENETVKQEFRQEMLDGVNEQFLKFQYKLSTTIKMSEDVITVVPSLRYSYHDEVIFETSAEFVYSIQTLSTALEVDRENRKINVKSNIFPSLLGASYSTLRGMAFAQTRNTPLAKFPAPVIESDTLLSRNGISVVD